MHRSTASASMRRGEKDGARSEIVHPSNRKKINRETLLVDSKTCKKSPPAVLSLDTIGAGFILAIVDIFTCIQASLSAL